MEKLENKILEKINNDIVLSKQDCPWRYAPEWASKQIAQEMQDIAIAFAKKSLMKSITLELKVISGEITEAEKCEALMNDIKDFSDVEQEWQKEFTDFIQTYYSPTPEV